MLLAFLFFLAVFCAFVLSELLKALEERERERARYVCRVSGEAWERANRK